MRTISIRAWKLHPGEPGGEEVENDETRLCVDLKTEDMLEARTYEFEPGMPALSYVMGSVVGTMVARGEQPDFFKATWTAIRIVENTRFQFAAKRRKDDGRVTYMLVSSTPRNRHILGHAEWIEEWEYREAVAAFETRFPRKDVLAVPTVVDADHWQRFSDSQTHSGPTFASNESLSDRLPRGWKE